MLGNRPVEAVIFDLDGTLIHTTVDFRRMKQRLLDELVQMGVTPALMERDDTIVNNLERAVRDLAARGRGSEEKGLRDRVGRLMSLTEMERVAETRPVEGATECLDALKGRGIGIGLLTRGSRAYAMSALTYAGLGRWFDALVCRDDFAEEEAKPNGLAMQRAAALLGTVPSDCVLVGDHLMDLTCARSVSASFVGVLTGAFSAEDWSLNGCPCVVGSVADLPSLLGAQKSI